MISIDDKDLSFKFKIHEKEIKFIHIFLEYHVDRETEHKMDIKEH